MSLTKDKYNTLFTELMELRSMVGANSITVAELRQHLTSLQQYFAQEIIPLGGDDALEVKYRTETSKQLRLLEIDITFLASARTEATVQTRLNTILERLTTLISYCEAVITPPSG
jgi:hypothetical protein